jgi:hypothetical protein
VLELENFNNGNAVPFSVTKDREFLYKTNHYHSLKNKSTFVNSTILGPELEVGYTQKKPGITRQAMYM